MAPVVPLHDSQLKGLKWRLHNISADDPPSPLLSLPCLPGEASTIPYTPNRSQIAKKKEGTGQNTGKRRQTGETDKNGGDRETQGEIRGKKILVRRSWELPPRPCPCRQFGPYGRPRWWVVTDLKWFMRCVQRVQVVVLLVVVLLLKASDLRSDRINDWHAVSHMDAHTALTG